MKHLKLIITSITYLSFFFLISCKSTQEVTPNSPNNSNNTNNTTNTNNTNNPNNSTNVQYVAIEDPYFEAYLVSRNFDDKLDYKISTKNAEKVVIIQDIDQDKIKSLKGIEALVNLEALTIPSNCNISELDLSSNKKLKSVDVQNNITLKRLNLSNLTLLEFLNFDNTKLSIIPDFRNLINLKQLICQNTGITTIALELSSNINLETLWVSSNNLQTINVSKNINLIEFRGRFNNFQNLDFSKNSKLTYVDASQNKSLSLICTFHLGLTKNWFVDNTAIIKECK